MQTISLILKWSCFLLAIEWHTAFTVYFSPNGGGTKYPFHVMDKDTENGWDELFIRLKKELPAVIERQSESEDWKTYRVYDSNGTNLKSTQKLLNYEGEQLYIVPRNRYFIWPHVRPGNRVHITNVDEINGPIILESISPKPRLFYIHNLFSKEEADILINTALTKTEGPNALGRSTTGTTPREDRDLEDIYASTNSIRTSDNAWDQDSPTAMGICRRIFSLLRMPFAESQKDGLQLVRYHPRNAYRAHHDYFPVGSFAEHNFDPSTGGSNRFVTVFLYLTDVEEGGQTYFPRGKIPSDEVLSDFSPDVANLLQSHKAYDAIKPSMEKILGSNTWEKTMSDACYTSLSVRPKLGSAVMFYSLTPDWRVDPSSLHGGCPVLNGTKWGSNIWIWSGPRHDKAHEVIKLKVQFKNTFDKTGKLYWKNVHLLTLEPNHSSDHNTYDAHTFRFEIDDVPVWSHTMDKFDGSDQQWLIEPKVKHQEL